MVYGFVSAYTLPHPIRSIRGASRSTRTATMTLRAQQPRNKILADLTKYTVSIAVASCLLYNHDTPTLFYVTASVANSAIGKVLKLLIKQPRPDGTHKEDPGMPSSHATSLSFLSLAFFGYVAKYMNSVIKTTGAGILVILALVATYWRVSAGYHTVPQVVAGWIVGSCNSMLFVALLPWALPRLAFLTHGKALIVTYGIAMVSCGTAHFPSIGYRRISTVKYTTRS